jgi:hypothetical protein
VGDFEVIVTITLQKASSRRTQLSPEFLPIPFLVSWVLVIVEGLLNLANYVSNVTSKAH